jgi:hypothetical protein
VTWESGSDPPASPHTHTGRATRSELAPTVQHTDARSAPRPSGAPSGPLPGDRTGQLRTVITSLRCGTDTDREESAILPARAPAGALDGPVQP